MATTRKNTSGTSGTASGGKRQNRSGTPDDPVPNYTAGLKWLYDHRDHERRRVVAYDPASFSLDRVHRLLEAVGNPHHQLSCVHVAGTKGKGSACAMLASMLGHCGYTVGLYTSPHLVDLRERIMVGGRMVSYPDATSLFREIADAEQRVLGDDRPSFFEIMTAAALLHFANQAVDVAILEAGLGGRLDSTTAVTPLVCGLTRVTYDHMNVLGHDLTSIAREKAGILKPEVPAVSVEQEREVKAVFDEVASERGTPLRYANDQIEFSYRFEASRELGPHTRVSVTTHRNRWEHLPVPLSGQHQAHNCGLALALFDELCDHGFEGPADKVMEGLAQTRLPGRMEMALSDPRVLLDGAHDSASLQALVHALGAHIHYDSLVVVFGCSEDKDVDNMLREVALGADKLVFTRARSHPRAMEPEDLLERFNEVSGKMAQHARGLRDALGLASRAVGREDLIVVTGSFYLVGEAKKYLQEKRNERRTRK